MASSERAARRTFLRIAAIGGAIAVIVAIAIPLALLPRFRRDAELEALAAAIDAKLIDGAASGNDDEARAVAADLRAPNAAEIDPRCAVHVEMVRRRDHDPAHDIHAFVRVSDAARGSKKERRERTLALAERIAKRFPSAGVYVELRRPGEVLYHVRAAPGFDEVEQGVGPSAEHYRIYRPR